MPAWLAFGILGTLSGLLYAVLGILASGHLLDAAARKSPDRFLMSGLIWSFSLSNFDNEGRVLAGRANVVLAVGVSAWLICWWLRTP